MYWVNLFKFAFKTITHINNKPISITAATVGATLAVAPNGNMFAPIGNPDEPIGNARALFEIRLPFIDIPVNQMDIWI